MYTRPRIIPCLLISDQDLVKTIKFSKPRYLGDPINAVSIFNEKGVDELVILDIKASSQGRGPQLEYLKKIASEAFMPLSYGGGITDIEEIKSLFHMGYEKVILNTSFIKNPDLVKEAVSMAGSQSIVVSIDVKTDLFGRKNCFTVSGSEKVNKSCVELVKLAEELGAGEILINSISEDGMMNGYDLRLIKSISDAVDVPVIACGGAGSTINLKEALDNGAHAVAAGSLFVYYGSEKAVLINFPEEKELYDLGIYTG